MHLYTRQKLNLSRELLVTVLPTIANQIRKFQQIMSYMEMFLRYLFNLFSDIKSFFFKFALSTFMRLGIQIVSLLIKIDYKAVASKNESCLHNVSVSLVWCFCSCATSILRNPSRWRCTIHSMHLYDLISSRKCLKTILLESNTLRE